MARISLDDVSHWLSNDAYWARGRTREAIETSIAHSHLYGVLEPSGATVACLRVVTDEATFAWLCDVYVDPRRRGQGIGTWMVGEVTSRWIRAGVPRVLLATRDAHEVYARVGFTHLANPERFMEVDRRGAF